jgi:hypothetical protein
VEGAALPLESVLWCPPFRWDNAVLLILKFLVISTSVADPHHIDEDSDPACHFDADPDPAGHLDSAPNPDPACPFDADVDPDFFTLIRIRILNFNLMRIRIRNAYFNLKFFAPFSCFSIELSLNLLRKLDLTSKR